ncbi:uncharacterized protein C4orf19 homolog [Varanus komodoensis]|uniref:Chromosome 4 open reading frame 19 n=1 Tax=Varanus komodoensis TaxID=61221 RepID=A0A8D2JIU2_VARKO|nr:uncharacterized protein C4orf19 homolog [Varanus komodoensis]
MGCRCCKMIQSYIFDPQELQTSGYVNEINNYKSDEQDGGKLKCKHSNDIQVHKNELQNVDFQSAANTHKLNNTKDVVWNHRSTALCEEGLGNLVEKCSFTINGIHSYSAVNFNPSTNQSKEICTHLNSGQLQDPSVKRVSQPKMCEKHEDQPKPTSEATRSVHYEEFQNTCENIPSAQSAISETQGSGIHVPGPNESPDASCPRKQRAAGNTSLLTNRTCRAQSTECLPRYKPSCESESCDSGDEPCRVCVKDKSSREAPSPHIETDAAEGAMCVCHKEVDRELEEEEEEDAEVAEALAALEAATAGEDSDEEEDY